MGGRVSGAPVERFLAPGEPPGYGSWPRSSNAPGHWRRRRRVQRKLVADSSSSHKGTRRRAPSPKRIFSTSTPWPAPPSWTLTVPTVRRMWRSCSPTAATEVTITGSTPNPVATAWISSGQDAGGVCLDLMLLFSLIRLAPDDPGCQRSTSGGGEHESCREYYLCGKHSGCVVGWAWRSPAHEEVFVVGSVLDPHFDPVPPHSLRRPPHCPTIYLLHHLHGLRWMDEPTSVACSWTGGGCSLKGKLNSCGGDSKKIPDKSTSEPEETEISINAKFCDIQPISSILSYVEDNLLGRRLIPSTAVPV